MCVCLITLSSRLQRMPCLLCDVRAVWPQWQSRLVQRGKKEIVKKSTATIVHCYTPEKAEDGPSQPCDALLIRYRQGRAVASQERQWGKLGLAQ